MTDVILSILGVLILGDALSKVEQLNWKKLHWAITYVITVAAGFCMFLTPFFADDPFHPESKYLLHALLLGTSAAANLLSTWFDVVLRHTAPKYAPDRRLNKTVSSRPTPTNATTVVNKSKDKKSYD